MDYYEFFKDINYKLTSDLVDSFTKPSRRRFLKPTAKSKQKKGQRNAKR